MKKYMGINYEEKFSCFQRTEHIRSMLLYGDVDAISDPLFTVLIPTYKRAALLKEAINSVLCQWHTPFFWDVIVLDNEAYDGKPNDAEKLIRRIDNPRVLYYRNSEHMQPRDNFNRGILLARGKWVMFLHDDDLLIANSLQNMGRLIPFLEGISKKPLGAVSAMHHPLSYDKEHPVEFWQCMTVFLNNYVSQPTSYAALPLTHWNVIFTGHIGGDVSSNGTTYRREAVLDMGGFNEDFGIFADRILYYCMENKYSVYSTLIPYGFYRWDKNTMVQSDSTYKTMKAGYDFREYVYSKNIFNRLWGLVFRTAQHRCFATDVIEHKKAVLKTEENLKSFDGICDKRPGPHVYAFYVCIVQAIYKRINGRKIKRICKKADKYLREMG